MKNPTVKKGLNKETWKLKWSFRRNAGKVSIGVYEYVVTRKQHKKGYIILKRTGIWRKSAISCFMAFMSSLSTQMSTTSAPAARRIKPKRASEFLPTAATTATSMLPRRQAHSNAIEQTAKAQGGSHHQTSTRLPRCFDLFHRVFLGLC